MARAKAAPQAGSPPARTKSTASDLDLLEALPQAACIIDPISGKIIRINSRLAELASLGEKEAVQTTLEGLLQLSSKEATSLRNGDGDSDGRLVLMGRLRSTQGPPAPVEVTISTFKRNRANQRLVTLKPLVNGKNSPTLSSLFKESYYDELFENANYLIFTHDPQGYITFANRAVLKAFGYTLEQALRLSINALIDKSFVPLVQSKIEESLKGEGFSPPYEALARTKDGSSIWLEITTGSISKDGVLISIQVIARNITDQKRAEVMRRRESPTSVESSEALEWMIEQSPYAIAFWNPDGSFHHGNGAYRQLIGGASERGLNILRQGLPPVAIKEFQEAFEGRVVHIERMCYDFASGSKRKRASCQVWVRIWLFPIVGKDGTLARVVTFWQDITREVNAEDAREKLEKRLLEAQKLEAIGALAGGIAHDLNNLLTGVFGYLDLIKSMTDPKVHAYVEKAEMVAKRGAELTRQLLAYARKSRVETGIHDLNSTLEEVVALLKPAIDKRIEIETRPSPLAAMINANAGQMSQILLNLCVNARDALNARLEQKSAADADDWQPRIVIQTRHHQITPGYCRKHPEAREGLCVRLSVTDTGAGMSKETCQRIFEPFFTTKDIGRGTGLGLATVLGIVKQHQGWVDVYSEPNEGTVFHVYFPAVDPHASPLSVATATPRIEGGYETILLVDGEEMIRELGREILQGKGYTVLVSSDGRAALEVFERERDRIDLVIMDMTTSQLPGMEALPRMLEMKPAIKVIAVSGYSFSDSWPDFHGMGATAFMQKPYNAIELAQTVRRVLGEKV